MKINWKFWKRRREEPTKKQQAIPASWMRYMLKVLPDPNEFYIKGEAPTNRIFYGEPDDVPIAGQAVISPHPRVESFVRGKAVVFVFSEFRREIEVPIVKSMEVVSYGSLDTEVETYLWDFSGLRVISDMGFAAVCRYLQDQSHWKANYLLERKDAEGDISPVMPREKGTGMNFTYMEPQKSFYGFMQEGEMPEERNEEDNESTC